MVEEEGNTREKEEKRADDVRRHPFLPIAKWDPRHCEFVLCEKHNKVTLIALLSAALLSVLYIYVDLHTDRGTQVHCMHCICTREMMNIVTWMVWDTSM